MSASVYMVRVVVLKDNMTYNSGMKKGKKDV